LIEVQIGGGETFDLGARQTNDDFLIARKRIYDGVKDGYRIDIESPSCIAGGPFFCGLKGIFRAIC